MSAILNVTKTEARTILSVAKGADITGYTLARDLRKIEAKYTANPKPIVITRVMGKYDPRGSQPYFGCIATKAGLDAAKVALKKGGAK